MIVRTSQSVALALVAAAAFIGPAIAAETKDVAPAASQPAPAGAITKEQAMAMALKAHPGEVTKAYEDTKKGKKTWEVKIKGNDGRKWELYYDIKTGELVAEEAD